MISANTCRLDSWWSEKRWRDERITARRRRQLRRPRFLWPQAQPLRRNVTSSSRRWRDATATYSRTSSHFDPPSTPALEVRPVANAPHNLCEVDGAGGSAVPLAFSPNHERLGYPVQWNSMSVSEIWVYYGQKERRPGAGRSTTLKHEKRYSGL